MTNDDLTLGTTSFYFVPKQTTLSQVTVIVQHPGVVYAVPPELLVGPDKVYNLNTAVLRDMAALDQNHVSDLYGRRITFRSVNDVFVDGVRLRGGLRGLAIAIDPHHEAQSRYGVPCSWAASNLFGAMCRFVMARVAKRDAELVALKKAKLADANGRMRVASCDSCAMLYRVPREPGAGQSATYHRALSVAEANKTPYQGTAWCQVFGCLVDDAASSHLAKYCLDSGIVDGQTLVRHVGYRDSGIADDALAVRGPVQHTSFSSVADVDKWAAGTGCLYRVFKPFRNARGQVIFPGSAWYLPLYETNGEFTSCRLGGLEFFWDNMRREDAAVQVRRGKFVVPDIRHNPRPSVERSQPVPRISPEEAERQYQERAAAYAERTRRSCIEMSAWKKKYC